MNSSSDKQKITAALRGWLKKPMRKPIVRVLESKRLAINLPTYFKEEPRLVLILKGVGSYLTMKPDGEQLLQLEAGQALFLAPCTWSCPVPDVSYNSLAITLRSDLTRVTIHSRQAFKQNPKIPTRYLAQWQSGASLGDRGKHLMKALEDPSDAFTGSTFFTRLVELIVSETLELVMSAPEVERSNANLLWHSISDYIAEHWSEPSLTRETVAAYFNRHPNHISRLFHRHTSKNLRGFLNDFRLRRGMELLHDLRYNVTDIALLCGFTDPQYFTRCFRHCFGLTPSEFRKRQIK
jgi:AraC-like DNA-binding protein